MPKKQQETKTPTRRRRSPRGHTPRGRQNGGGGAATKSGSKSKAAAASASATAPLSRGQVAAFLLTYVAYIGVYFTRKPFTNSKATLKATFVHTESELGGIDTGFLISYAIGQFTAGTVESYLGAKYGMAACFIGSGCACLLFGTTGSKDLRWAAWVANGVFQALFYPFSMSVLSAWFPPATRGRALGMWGTSPQVAGTLSSLFGAYVLQSEALTWHHLFIFPAYTAFALSAVCVLFLAPTPGAGSVASADASKSASSSKGTKRKQSFTEVLLMKNVLNVGGAYFCIKLVRYIFLNWLGFYLQEVLQYSAAEAVLYATMLDLAGALGSIGSGFVADKVFGGKSILAILPMCVVCSCAAFIYPEVASYGKTYNVVVMAVIGIMIAGPDCVLGSSACAEVCEKNNRPLDITTATGIVNGMGSVGAIASGYLPILVKKMYGWNALFHMLSGLGLIGTVFILGMAKESYTELGERAKTMKKK